MRNAIQLLPELRQEAGEVGWNANIAMIKWFAITTFTLTPKIKILSIAELAEWKQQSHTKTTGKSSSGANRIGQVSRMDELKSCPFCGGAVEIVPEGDYVEIVCEECGIAMDRGSVERTIEDWNKRAGDAT